MKKIFFFSLLAISTISLAQETKPQEKEGKGSIYFGGGFVSNSKFTIDDKLEASNLPQIQANVPEFVFGFNTFFNKGFLDIEASSNMFKKSNSATTSNGGRSNFRLRGHYNIVNNKDFVFSGGLNLAFTSNDINVYSQSNQVDINNLAVSTSNYFRLRNNMFLAGPSIGFGIKNKGEQLIRLNVGYEFALISGKWKSDYATVSNSINENGQSRLMVGAIFFLNNHSK
jgi:hypothetical protein